MTFVRYIAVQVVAYGIDMGVFLAVLSLGIFGPVISNVPAKIAAGVFAFFVHQHFTFRVSRAEREKKQAVQYFLLLALNVPISSAVLSLVLLVIDWTVPAKFVSDVLCVAFSFWVSKKWVFRATGRSTVPSGPQEGPS